MNIICKESKEPNLVWSILKQKNILIIFQGWKWLRTEKKLWPKMSQDQKFIMAENFTGLKMTQDEIVQARMCQLSMLGRILYS